MVIKIGWGVLSGKHHAISFVIDWFGQMGI